jgi:hypothetical protein
MQNLMDPVELEGRVVCRDDEDPRKFFVLPNQPEIPLDDQGHPQFLFIDYINDLQNTPEGAEVGGGFVQFRTVLTLPDEQRRAIVDGLRSILEQDKAAGKAPFGHAIDSTEPLLADPLWSDGKVNLATFAASPTGLVRHTTQDAPVDLIGDLGAMLAVELDNAGADVFWGAFKNFADQQIPIAILYDLTYKARIAARMEIHAKHEVIRRVIWEQARPWRMLSVPFVRYVPIQDFTGVLSPDRLAAVRTRFAEPIAPMIEWPQITDTISRSITNNTITVKIDTDEADTGAAGGKVQAALFEIATQILSERVIPLLFGGAALQPGAASDSDPQANKDLVEVSQTGPDGDASFDLVLDERSTVERVIHPNGPVHILLGSPQATAACFRQLRLSDGILGHTTVVASTAGVDFALDGIAAVHVSFRYQHNDEGDPSKPVLREWDGTLKSASDSLSWRFDLARTKQGSHISDYDYRVDVQYADGQRTQTGWMTSSDRALLITPRAMGAIRVDVVLTAPPDQVNAADVTLRYQPSTGAALSTTLHLTQTDARQSWLQYTGEPVGDDVHRPTYSYEVRYHVPDSELVMPPQQSNDQTLEVGTPFTSTLKFVVRPQGSFDGVSNISGDISYEDPRHNYRVTQSFQLTGLTASFEFDVPVFPDAPQNAHWTGRLNRVNGSGVQLGPGDAPPGTVWIGTDSDFQTIQVLADLIDFDADVQLAVVALSYSDAGRGTSDSTTLTFSKDAKGPQQWNVPRGEPYDAHVRFIRYDRTKSTEVDIRQTSDQVLVLDPTAATAAKEGTK